MQVSSISSQFSPNMMMYESGLGSSVDVCEVSLFVNSSKQLIDGTAGYSREVNHNNRLMNE